MARVASGVELRWFSFQVRGQPSVYLYHITYKPDPGSATRCIGFETAARGNSGPCGNGCHEDMVNLFVPLLSHSIEVG